MDEFTKNFLNKYSDNDKREEALRSNREQMKFLNLDLIKFHGFESKKIVNQRNMIDMTDFKSVNELNDFCNLVKNRIMEEYPDKKDELQKFAHIPPFEHGVLKSKTIVNGIDTIIYAAWDIKSIDLDKMVMDIIFRYYIFDNRDDFKGFKAIGIVEVNQKLNSIADTNLNVTTVKDILPDDLLFNDKDVQEYFDMAYYGTLDVENFLIGISENTMLLIIVFNMYLLLNKNKTTTKRSNSTKTLSVNYENPKNEKKVRILGKIKITSDKAPKAHTNVVTIRKYKCASWTVRAHIRHYKNGKVSIIKEQTRYRKNMNKIEPAQRVIKFKP